MLRIVIRRYPEVGNELAQKATFLTSGTTHYSSVNISKKGNVKRPEFNERRHGFTSTLVYSRIHVNTHMSNEKGQ